jgi:hypothetical protein
MSASCHFRTHALQQTALHSITSSARTSRVGEISRPSDLAVLRLTTSSNFVAGQFGRVKPNAVSVVAHPPIVDQYIGALCPAELLETVHERRSTKLRFRIALTARLERTNASHPLRLLRPRHQRPRCCAAENSDELASSHEPPALWIEENCGLTIPHHIASVRTVGAWSGHENDAS